MITKHNEYCDWDCRSYLDAIIMIIVMMTAIGVTVYCSKTYLKILQTGKVKKELHYKFIAMLSWGVSIILIMQYMLEVTYSQLQYSMENSNSRLTINNSCH
jgi:hypothetical protein